MARTPEQQARLEIIAVALLAIAAVISLVSAIVSGSVWSWVATALLFVALTFQALAVAKRRNGQ